MMSPAGPSRSPLSMSRPHCILDTHLESYVKGGSVAYSKPLRHLKLAPQILLWLANHDVGVNSQLMLVYGKLPGLLGVMSAIPTCQKSQGGVWHL